MKKKTLVQDYLFSSALIFKVIAIFITLYALDRYASLVYERNPLTRFLLQHDFVSGSRPIGCVHFYLRRLFQGKEDVPALRTGNGAGSLVIQCPDRIRFFNLPVGRRKRCDHPAGGISFRSPGLSPAGSRERIAGARLAHRFTLGYTPLRQKEQCPSSSSWPAWNGSFHVLHRKDQPP